MKKPTPRRHPTPAPAAIAPAAGDLLDLDQAIARLATTRPTFYRWLRSGRIAGQKVGRQWRFRRQDLEAFLRGEAAREPLTADIAPLHDALVERLRAAGVKPEGEPPADPVVATVRLMLRLGVALRASDLHLEVTNDQPAAQVRLRYRLDGVLSEAARGDIRLLLPLIQQWKRMAACDLNERRLPQDGRILASIDGVNLDCRVNFLPAVYGEALTVRFLASDAVQLSLDRIPFTPHNRTRLDAALARPWGIIFCAGPTGSGKTTTMYASLMRLVGPAVKVVSIEDPVEYRLPGVTQLGVHPAIGLGFAQAMRAVLRSDPDVIQIGEIRDRDTLQCAMQAALTGHLVLTQLHTPDAASALVRTNELSGAGPWLTADTVILVISQRLVRRLCPHCSVACRLDPALEERAMAVAREGGLAWAELPRDYRRAVGCGQCGQTGYRGRLPINEMLTVEGGVTAALRRGADGAELRRIAVAQGMVTLAADGLWRAARGETTFEEVLRTVPPEM